LIAAASDATVVLEAGMRSGSLNTAGHAAALGRPLGAVPGPVTSPASAGCHRLFREYDAVCVVDAAQMAELATTASTGSARVPADGSEEPREAAPGDAAAGDAMDPERLRVLDAMSTRSRRDVDDIARRAGMTVMAVMGALAVLESHGTVAFRGDGWVRRRSA
jgi:DNA processing protein